MRWRGRFSRRWLRQGLVAVVVFAQLIAATGAPLPTPPRDAAPATATSRSPAPQAPLCSGGSSCCCATSGGITCGCCCSVKIHRVSVEMNSHDGEFRWVGGLLMAKCRGDGPGGLLKAELVAVLPPAPAVPKAPQPPRFVFPTDWQAMSSVHRPPTPPPRLS